jgi:hypothetical protein
MSSGRCARVRTLSALQHVFLVVVSLLLLGASTARAQGYEPTCAALYDSSTDGAMANVLPGTHAFTANNVLYARLDITYYDPSTTASLFVWGGSGASSCGAWRGGFLGNHMMYMDVQCNDGGSVGVYDVDPNLNAGGRYVLEYVLELNYYDSQTSNVRMYKTCVDSCGGDETPGVTVEVTPAGGTGATLVISDGPLSVGYDEHEASQKDTDFTGTIHSAAFYDCPPPPRAYGYEPTCAALYDSSTDGASTFSS